MIPDVDPYRREDTKEKKFMMDTYWTPGVNHLDARSRWAFVEFCDAYEMQEGFADWVQAEFDKVLANLGVGA